MVPESGGQRPSSCVELAAQWASEKIVRGIVRGIPRATRLGLLIVLAWYRFVESDSASLIRQDHFSESDWPSAFHPVRIAQSESPSSLSSPGPIR